MGKNSIMSCLGRVAESSEVSEALEPFERDILDERIQNAETDVTPTRLL